MIISKNLYKCPHCSKTIRYVNDKLIEDNATIYSKEDIEKVALDISKLKIEKQKLETKNNYLTYIQQLIPMLRIMKHGDDIPKDISELDTYKKYLTIAEQIKIIPENYIGIEELTKIVEYKELLNSYNSFDKKQMDILSDNINNIKLEMLKIPQNIDAELQIVRKKIADIKSNISEVNSSNIKALNEIEKELQLTNQRKIEYQKYLSDLDFINKDVTSIKLELDNLNKKLIPNIKDKIEGVMKEIENLKLWKFKSSQLIKVNEKYEVLKVKKLELNERNKKLVGLYALKQTAFDLECNHLQTTVDSINESLNDILQSIFEKPIKIILNLYKKNKSNDKIRANVNLNIQYDGNEYDSINKLSGGEKDRISFALTLALSRINGSEFLLLDETLRSLNDDYRVLCLETMRNFFGTTKTILCINHEDIEGNYDKVIQLQ